MVSLRLDFFLAKDTATAGRQIFRLPRKFGLTQLIKKNIKEFSSKRVLVLVVDLFHTKSMTIITTQMF